MKFPTVPGRDTRGTRLALPDDLNGEQTLLVVSFHHRQRSLVGSWRRFAEELSERFEHFGYYELVVGARSGMVPPSVNGGLSQPSATYRQHDNTIRVSVDKTAFRRRLGMVGEQTIYAFLLEDDYVVRREAGVLTPSVGEGLESLLESYRDAKHTRLTGTESAGESSG
ncbi:hypothetical protein GCM10008995_20790 [Halobellus salinus]|uniref:Uncharacterized protein n=1 Tax=Halobellus salinus TaxID=931585 RepID=A0A830EHI3_9EURY|nr:hypothetical protein [Halobellus salinus]GGJ10763.1 hypothetical protein GCM10008995_20790 [Halobellus salinus]SMP10379.1 hypothetical protein SAMN06265347_103177 [Halobellus salinus]